MGLPASSILAGTDFTAAEVLELPVSFPMANGSLANSNLETIIGTFTIPAGTITAVNQGFKWLIACSCGGTGSPTLTVRMRAVNAAGTIIGSGANTVTSASAWFTFEGWMMFNTVGAGGLVTCRNTVDEAFNGSAGPPLATGDYLTNAVAWNTTAANQILVTAQFSAANAANVAAGLAGNAYML